MAANRYLMIAVLVGVAGVAYTLTPPPGISQNAWGLFVIFITAIGAILGASGIDPKTWGIDMVISGMFTLTVIGLWRGKQDVLPWIAAIATALLGLFWLPGNAYLLLGGFAAGSVGLFTAPKPDAAP